MLPDTVVGHMPKYHPSQHLGHRERESQDASGPQGHGMAGENRAPQTVAPRAVTCWPYGG